MSEHPVELHSQIIQRHEDTLEGHEKRLQTLEKDAAVQKEQISNLFVAVGKIECNSERTVAALDSMRMAPAKKWNSLVDKLTMLTMGALVAYVAQQVLK